MRNVRTRMANAPEEWHLDSRVEVEPHLERGINLNLPLGSRALAMSSA